MTSAENTALSDLQAEQKLRFGQLVAKYRTEQNFSQSEFSDKINLSQSVLSLIENGKQFPTLQTLVAIIDTLGKQKSDFAVEMLLKIILPSDDALSLSDKEIENITATFKKELASAFKQKMEKAKKQLADLEA